LGKMGIIIRSMAGRIEGAKSGRVQKKTPKLSSEKNKAKTYVGYQGPREAKWCHKRRPGE